MANDLLLFRANTGIDTGLWVSDGTSAGTWRLDDNAVIFLSNFIYPSFTPLGGQDLFGTVEGLWVTDGTSAGTSELSVNGAASVDFQPENLLRLGSEVLFEGTDANNKAGLWVTNGTSAGTSEISVTGANSNGINFGSGGAMTVFGSEALFAGFDAQRNHALWITDGTAAGTSEISVSGSFQNGNIFGGGFIPGFRFAALGGEVLFPGFDASDQLGLWVTDGTSAGTSELSVSVPGGLNPDDLTTFGSKVLFIANDVDNPNGGNGLWISDGTAGGTTEISVAQAGPNGLFGFGPQGGGFLVFGGKAFFTGFDSANKLGLWVTDGTSAGTTEISVANASSGGLDPNGMLADGSEVLFNGVDASGREGLWVTDGTAAGTSEISIPGDMSHFGLNPTGFGLLNQDLLVGNVPTSAAYAEGNRPVTIAPELRISDTDSTTIASATVAIAGGTFQGDTLAATTAGPISASYDSSTETLTLTGSDTLSDYDSVLDSVTFTNVANNGSNSTRTLTWVVDDGTASNNLSAAQTTTVSILPFALPPTLTGVPAVADFGEDSSIFLTPQTTFLSRAVSLTDPESPTLASATVAITSGTFAGDNDLLNQLIPFTSITTSYNSSTETLTLTGTDTLLDYQFALGSVAFSATGDNPSNFGSDPTRTVVWTLNDGNVQNTPITETVDVFAINNPPTLSIAASAHFTEEAGATTLSGALSVSDPDDLTLSGATVRITGGAFAGDGDVLSATTAGTNIVANYNSTTGTLTLAGTDSLADYQSVLDSVTFNAGENPTDFGSNPTRSITWTATDTGTSDPGTGINKSFPITTTVTITNVNDPPTLSGVAANATVRGPGQTVTLSPAVVLADPDNLTLAGATVAITGGIFSGDGDVLAATTTGTAIAASYDATRETLTLAGTDTFAHYAQVLDSVTFNSGGATPTNVGSHPTRTISWVLNDGSGSNNLSTPVTTTISFQPEVPFDLNGDGNSDLVFQNNGQAGVWLMNGTSPIAEAGLGNPGPSWHIVGSRDLNGDGNADLVWQNTDGTGGIWLMNGTTPIAELGFASPGASWHIVGSGDFNGDGMADLVWQNSDGTLGVWLMNGTTPIAEAGIGNPGTNWKVVGAADYNGDGRDDILLQNSTTGNLMIDLMNGTSVASTASINVGDPSWHAVSTGVFNGQAEIAWQNSNGMPAIWAMNGTTPVAEAALPNPGPAWQVVSLDHFAPNGQAGLLFQNTNGAMGLWQMNGTTIVAETGLLSPASGWQSVNGHPFATG